MLHNSVVALELSRVMLQPRDVEELDSQAINEMVNRIFSIVIKVSPPLFYFSSLNIGKGVP